MQENEIKVNVTYPDEKGAHETTVGELKERFKEETPEWLASFISEIVNKGKGFTLFGEYTRQENPFIMEYVRDATAKKDGHDGLLFGYNWATGYELLIFPDNEKAEAFAARQGITRFKGKPATP